MALVERSYFSPFKINLGLEVLAKRPDGYHEINTIFYKFTEPHDTLKVSPSEQFSFTTTDPDLPVDDRNLVVRAISFCAELRGLDLPSLSIKLEKVLPHGAGIGGGSANAATAIRLYSEQVEALSFEEQISIGRRLGADVPFFLYPSRAMKASGIGDVLEPLDFDLNYFCLIVKPQNIQTSTTASYAGLKVSGRREQTDLPSLITNEHPSLWSDKVTNDFEKLAFERYPELVEIKNTFLQRDALFTLMSGSGAAVYGLFASFELAERAAQSFRERYADGFVAIAK